jgi:3'-5' exoribonuclease-like protein
MLDTEFLEYGMNGHGMIELISIGVVSEYGHTYYAENALFDWRRAEMHNNWLLENVNPHLDGPGSDSFKHPVTIKEDLLEFLGKEPEIWGYYADYDWVVFCWLFGRMIQLPDGYPMFCRDLKQLMVENSVPSDVLPDRTSGEEHNALADAKHQMKCLTVVEYYLNLRGPA